MGLSPHLGDLFLKKHGHRLGKSTAAGSCSWGLLIACIQVALLRRLPIRKGCSLPTTYLCHAGIRRRGLHWSSSLLSSPSFCRGRGETNTRRWLVVLVHLRVRTLRRGRPCCSPASAAALAFTGCSTTAAHPCASGGLGDRLHEHAWCQEQVEPCGPSLPCLFQACAHAQTTGASLTAHSNRGCGGVNL